MKNFLPFILIPLVCACQQNNISQEATQQIINADNAMNAMAAKEGFNKALLFYADDSVIKTNDGQFPFIGKNALINAWAGKKDTKEISWKPFKAEASKSGDIGYTIGNWKYFTKDTTLYGNYYTIWKKQNDGSWKFVFDSGNNTPKPKE
jgi:ketosteroid isomerase-like protein